MKIVDCITLTSEVYILAHNFCKTIGGATSIAHVRDFDLPHDPTKFHIKFHHQLAMLEHSQHFHILACVLHNIIGGATSIAHVHDFDLPP